VKPPADHHVVLIGLPGAGKTNIGRHLAKLLQRPFADVDEQVELSCGCTIPQLVRTHGDGELRRREGQVLADLLRRYDTLVIAAPGAIEIDELNQDLLAWSAVVFWIRGSLDLLAEISDPTHRPRLDAGHRESLARLDAELSAHYRDIADLVVDVDRFHTLDEEPRQPIARHIVDALTTGKLAGTVRLPDDSLAQADHPPGGKRPDEAELSALYELAADHTVDLAAFEADDDPKQALVHHITELLTRDS